MSVKITGRMLTFSRITLETNDQDAILKQLNHLAKSSPLADVPIVLDSTVEQELIEIIQLLVGLGLQPMAVIDGLLTEQARDIQFPVLPKDKAVQRIKATDEQSNTATIETPNQQETATNSTAEEPPTQEQNEKAPIQVLEHKTSFHHQMLRTGQCLVQDQGDIVITSTMNSGSEAIASGNIYIYGHARGRLLAGTSGNINARIFCSSLESELVSIAGVYCLADDLPSHLLGRPTHIYLNAQQELVFEALSL